jgi:hypothetical protein
VYDAVRPYSPIRLITDQHQGDAIASYFGRAGIPTTVVNLTLPTQTQAFTSTRTRLVDGSLRCWKHPGLVEDLRRIRVRDTQEAIVLPRYAGGHCDAASALALAVWAQRAVTDRPPAVIRPPIVRDIVTADQFAALDGRPKRGRGGVDPDRAKTPSLHPPPDFWGGEESIWTRQW